MKVLLSMQKAEQVLEISDIEMNGMTKEEIEKVVYYRYGIPFSQLHNKVDVKIIEEGRPNR